MGSLYTVDLQGVVTCKGLRLPSLGGVTETLEYNGSETITFQMTGSVTPTFDFPVKFTRTGKLVVMQWDGFQKNTTNTTDFLFTADLVPGRFLPSFPSGNPLVWRKTVINGPDFFSFGEGSLSFGSSGNIQIGTGFFGGFFTSACCGILGSSISYLID